MEDEKIYSILERLRSSGAAGAWSEFLQLYSPIILQVVQFFERDADHAADCFVFVCEQLSRKRFQRLRRFQLKGRARFSTWLRVVVRNLCVDWHRKEFGRRRIFESIARLPTLDRKIFRCAYEDGMSPDQAFLLLRAHFPHLTMRRIGEGLERIRQSLTSRQQWLLSVRNLRVEALETLGASEEQVLGKQIPDPRADPEALAALNEQRAAVATALSRLEKNERLLLRLRFEQGLTLAEIGRVTQLEDAQSVDRRIRKILERLRKDMT